MTSILDQYEQASIPSQTTELDASNQRQYDYLNTAVDENAEHQPVFNLKTLNLVPSTTYRLQHISVGNDTLAYVTSSNILFIYDWRNMQKTEEIDIGRLIGGTFKVKNLYLDPVVGRHLFIPVTFTSGNSGVGLNSNMHDLYYFNSSCSNFKLKQIVKFKNHELSAVGWNRMFVNNYCSSFILLGTSKGLIFELEINLESEKLFQSGVETYCRQVFDVGKNNTSTTITGIEFHRFCNVPENYFILVTTANRLYQFIGKTNTSEEKPVLSHIFSNYLNAPEGFIEFPNRSFSSVLRVFYSSAVKEVKPSCFAWHIGDIGIFFGKLNTRWEDSLSSVCIQNRVIDYQPTLPPPISIALTEFHVLLLYADKLIAVSNVNKENIFVYNNDEASGKYISICDDCEGNVWILSERNIHTGKFIKEDRLIWKIYMNMNEFSLAKYHSKDNPNCLRTIMKKEAEYEFSCGRYRESAALYSSIDGISFEEVALKFLEEDQLDALKLYLIRILDKLKPYESAHITVVTLWLFEVFEKQLTELKNDHNKREEYSKVQDEFKTFLSHSAVVNCVKRNKEMVYKVINSHGDAYNFTKLATDKRDYDSMVKYYLEEEQIYCAIDLFKEEPLSLIRKYLTKSFLTEFMIMAPKETVDLLIKLGRNVEPSLLLSSVIVPNDNLDRALEIIRYLEYCVHSLHLRDESIHNYLITLYAKYKPDKLMEYLATQGQDASMVNYDIRYVLKLCQEYNLKEACVQVSSLLGLWESAVDLALNVNLDLAKQTAAQPSHQNVELCKRLWLKIAQHVVHECNDIEKAMEFLQNCDLIKIEDVLPFFSDFTTIDLFKDAICSTLQEYNEHIEHLKEEMDDAINSAESIRSSIHTFKHKYAMIHSSKSCCSCGIQLLLRPFYAFPCSHYFHQDCLIAEMEPHLDQCNSNTLQDLQASDYNNQITDLYPIPHNDDSFSVNSSHFRSKEELKLRLDKIIANECPYCGSLTISRIDKPFVNEEDFDKAQLDWQ